MKDLIKFGIYAAATVGAFELARRYGLLQKAGEWLSEQVPDEYKDRAREVGGKVRDRVGQFGEELHGYVDQARGKVGDLAEQGKDMATKAVGSVKEMTEDMNGTSVPHNVGRGVI